MAEYLKWEPRRLLGAAATVLHRAPLERPQKRPEPPALLGLRALFEAWPVVAPLAALLAPVHGPAKSKEESQ